jgi:hypothetical protein
MTNDTQLTIAAVRVLSEVLDDIEAGLYEEGAILAGFSDLHDFVDANEYIDAAAQEFVDPADADAYDRFVEDLLARVDSGLALHPLSVDEVLASR